MSKKNAYKKRKEQAPPESHLKYEGRPSSEIQATLNQFRKEKVRQFFTESMEHFSKTKGISFPRLEKETEEAVAYMFLSSFQYTHDLDNAVSYIELVINKLLELETKDNSHRSLATVFLYKCIEKMIMYLVVQEPLVRSAEKTELAELHIRLIKLLRTLENKTFLQNNYQAARQLMGMGDIGGISSKEKFFPALITWIRLLVYEIEEIQQRAAKDFPKDARIFCFLPTLTKPEIFRNKDLSKYAQDELEEFLGFMDLLIPKWVESFSTGYDQKQEVDSPNTIMGFLLDQQVDNMDGRNDRKRLIPSLLEKRAGAHTLKTLLELPNQVEFNQQALQYIHELLNGNAFHLLFILQFFFFIPSGSQHVEFPELTNRLILFQQWIGDQLFPAEDKEIDPQFIKKFREIILRLDVSGVLQLAKMVTTSAQLSEENTKKFSISSKDTYSSGIHHQATQQFPVSAKDIGAVDTRYEVTRYLREQLSKKHTSLGEVLRDGNPNTDMFLYELENQLFRNVEHENGAKLKSFIEEQIGREFLSTLADKYADVIVEVTTQVNSSRNKLSKSYGLRKDVAYTVQFSERSFPQLLGLTEVSFFVYEDMGDVCYFFIKTKDSNLVISGHINSQGKIFDISTRFEQTDFLLPLLLEHIVSVTHKDLIIREEHVDKNREHTADATVLSSLAKDEDYFDLEETDNVSNSNVKKNRKSKSATWLPQKEGTSTYRQNLKSDGLIEDVEEIRKQEGVAIYRRVGAFRRRVRGAAFVEECIAEIQENLANMDPNLSTLQREKIIAKKREFLREVVDEYLGNPHPKKLETVPASIDLNFVLDPITGELFTDSEGKARSLRTWVVPHTRPKMSEEAQVDLATFERLYKNGSSFAWLDELVRSFIRIYELDTQSDDNLSGNVSEHTNS